MPSAVSSSRELTAVETTSSTNTSPAAPVHRPVWVPWSLAAACLLIALALGTLYAAEKTRRIIAEQEQSTAVRSATQMEQKQARSDSLLATLLAPQVLSATITAPAGAVSARIFYDRAGRDLVMAVFNLPSAPDGTRYHLWGDTGSRRIDLGWFNTQSERAVVRIKVPAGDVLSRLSITLPEGPSPAPEAQVLAGSW